LFFSCFALLLAETKCSAQIFNHLITTDVTCNGLGNGTATVSITDGIGPFEMLWLNSGNTGWTETGLGPGNHAVQINDLSNNQVFFQQATIEEPDVLVAYFVNNSNPTCADFCDGSVILEIVGGTPPYSIQWPDGSIVSNDGLSATGLCPGPLMVSVSDANDCSASNNMFLDIPEPIVLSTLSVTDATCAGNDGSVSVQATGGNGGDYTYLWSDGQTVPNATDLAPGTYTVEVVDELGCASQTLVTVDGSTSTMSATIIATDTSCSGAQDGIAVVNVSGGTPPFTYVWSDGNSQIDSGSLSGASLIVSVAGTYSVVVTDANGCIASVDFEIYEPLELTGSVSTTDVTCFGLNDGTAVVNVTGGTPPYQENYGADQNALAAGMYTLQVTDANLCTLDIPYEILEPDELIISNFGTTDATCTGCSNGSLVISASGGEAPYSYSYVETSSGITSDPTALAAGTTALAAGTYEVQITDANGCTISNTFEIGISNAEISETATLEIQVNTTDVLCNGSFNGTANLSIAGGTGPFEILWESGNIGTTETGLAPGSHTVVVTDLGEESSSITQQFDILEPEILIAFFTEPTDVTCSGSCDGTVSLTIEGGTPPYNFQWPAEAIVASDGLSATGICPGILHIPVIDANNCASSASTGFDFPDELVMSNSVVSDATCSGCSDGSVQIVASGGEGPYTYETIETITGITVDPGALAAGTYEFIATDALGCETSTAFEVGEDDDITSSIDSNNSFEAMNIYPNPVRNISTLSLAALVEGKVASIRLIDLYGKVLWTDQTYSSKYDFHKGNIAPGIYLLESTVDGEANYVKVIIE